MTTTRQTKAAAAANTAANERLNTIDDLLIDFAPDCCEMSWSQIATVESVVENLDEVIARLRSAVEERNAER